MYVEYYSTSEDLNIAVNTTRPQGNNFIQVADGTYKRTIIPDRVSYVIAVRHRLRDSELRKV